VAKSDIRIIDHLGNIPINTTGMIQENIWDNFDQKSVLTRINTYDMSDMHLLEQFLFSHLPYSSKVFRLVVGSISSTIKQVHTCMYKYIYIYMYEYINICMNICMYTYSYLYIFIVAF
jgi:hypothetical protein